MVRTLELPLIQISSELNNQDTCTISFDHSLAYPGEDSCELKFLHPILGTKIFKRIAIFQCLCELRLFLEEYGWNIVCNGSRIDSYPSGMSMNMAGGAKIYKRKMDIEPTRDDLIAIFDQTDRHLVGTVEEQFEYYKNWLSSIRSLEAE